MHQNIFYRSRDSQSISEEFRIKIRLKNGLKLFMNPAYDLPIPVYNFFFSF
jgi:hypothetical protein